MSSDDLNNNADSQQMQAPLEPAITSAPPDSSAEASPGSASAQAAPKKRAGRRPRKAVATAASDATSASDAVPLSDVVSVTDASASDATPVAGAVPASDAAAPSGTSSVSGVASSVAADEVALPVTPPSKTPPKRRPGRPRKVKTDEASVAQGSSVGGAKESTSSDSPTPEPAPKRRPGRPRKTVPASPAQETPPAENTERSEPESSKPNAPEEEDAAPERSVRQSRDERETKGDFPAKSERYERYERRPRQVQRDHRVVSKQQNGKQTGLQNRSEPRRQRRAYNGRDPIAPKTNKEELSKLKVAELRTKAAELDIDVVGLRKAELVEKVYDASVRAEGFIEVRGILDTLQDGYGFLRTKGYLPSETDVYVGLATIRRNNLRKGDMVIGQTRPKRENEKYAALQQVSAVNGVAVEELGQRVRFGDLTPVFPDECLVMEHGHSTITARVIDLVSPIGKGQRGLIVSPPKAGKTTVLKDIAAAITANNPEVHLMCLLVDERPEEVTDMQRSIKGEVIASTFDMPTENHIAVSALVIERAKRLVEGGADVVVLLDSLTRLARAYNLAQPASGRILSGGVDSTALYPPKRFLGAARNIEGGGSLTILASALIETGSKMDEVIFEEFKGTGNMELKLDRSLADRRVFPAIDPVSSGTRREDLLLDPQEAPLIWAVRRILANVNSTERAMDMLIKSLKQTSNNQEFLLRTAKKAQSQRDSETLEL